jgi:O-antigen/teichoic acid export membrane protein
MYKLPVQWFAAAYVTENVLSAVLIWSAFHGRNKDVIWVPDAALGKKLLSESRYELISHLALMSLFKLSGMMVGWLHGQAEAGIYAAAVRIAEVTYFLAVVFSVYVFRPLVQLRQSAPEAYRLRVADYLAGSVCLGLVLAVVQTVLADFSMRILAGQQFRSSTVVLQILAWTTIPYFMGIARNQFLAAEGALRSNAVSMLIAVGTHMLLCLLLIPRGGALGGAVATLTAFCVAWMGSSPLFTKQREAMQLLALGIRRLPGAWARLRQYGLAGSAS